MKAKDLVVISGKGGTGKTSITAALAQCFSSSVIADCDVDAADLHLLFRAKSYKVKPFQSGHVAQIISDRCHACGICASLCRFHAIQKYQDSYVISETSCEGCKVCVDACPENAIEWNTAQNGVSMESVTNHGMLFHARLYPGAENSGKLVSHVRERAKKIANQNNLELVLVDGPPGIGCPVIASVTGASAVLIVTEPTPSGLHDLERVLVLARHFQVPAMVLINKYDLSQEYCTRIEELSLQLDAKVVARIRYSSLFSQAQLKGKSILEVFPESEEAHVIRELGLYLSEILHVRVQL